jgi:hypothetical protein
MSGSVPIKAGDCKAAGGFAASRRAMVIDRRALLTGAGAVLAAGLAPRSAAALATSDALVLAPARRADGGYAVMVFGERGELIREIALPARAHDLAVHPESGRAVVFARRPGTFAVAFDVHGRVAPQVFIARPDRHFFGHGAYSADGRLLFATENDFGAGAGVIGVYDATGSYARIGEFPTRGVGTHEAILLPDGKTLAIANGGIETHPDWGREMLNIPSMDPSLAFVDLDGHLIAQHRLPERYHQLSIRHMAVGADGAIWFGTQWEGDPLETPPLVGRATLDGRLALVAMPERELNDMRRYIGAMAASRDGTVVSASAPRGGYVVHFSAASGTYLGRTAIPDSSGITGYGSKSVLASNGEGLILEADADGTGRAFARRSEVAFDNHLRTYGLSRAG